MHLPAIRRSFVSILLLLACTAFAFGQYSERALERARSVKMLTDDREAVRKIFHDFNLDDSDETSDEFSFGDTQVDVTYSSGTCDEDEKEIWKVTVDKVIRIRIEDYDEWKAADLRLDFSKFTKEQVYRGVESRFVFHSKTDGIAIEIDEDDVDYVQIFPPIKSKVKVCKSDFAKDFIREKSWFGKVKLEERSGEISCPAANVTALELSHLEIGAVTARQIDVTTTAIDPENDVLTYVYTVTGGRITGSGSKVKWDLTDVHSGTYMITAAVDDGCGFCGQTKSVTVVVK